MMAAPNRNKKNNIARFNRFDHILISRPAATPIFDQVLFQLRMNMQ